MVLMCVRGNKGNATLHLKVACVAQGCVDTPGLASPSHRTFRSTLHSTVAAFGCWRWQLKSAEPDMDTMRRQKNKRNLYG
jgi:hypothetical protein